MRGSRLNHRLGGPVGDLEPLPLGVAGTTYKTNVTTLVDH